MPKTTKSNTYRGYPINTGKDNNLSCNTKKLDQVKDTVETNENHSKALAARLDIHSEKNLEKALTRRDVTRVMEITRRNINSNLKIQITILISTSCNNRTNLSRGQSSLPCHDIYQWQCHPE